MSRTRGFMVLLGDADLCGLTVGPCVGGGQQRCGGGLGLDPVSASVITRSQFMFQLKCLSVKRHESDAGSLESTFS